MSQVDTNTSWEFLLDEYFFVKYLRPQTEWSYRKVVNVFRKYYGMERKPCEITRRDVQQWRRHVINVEGSSANTWNNKVAHMRAIMNYAMKANHVPQTENPFNEVVVPANKKRKKTLSRPQLTRVYLLMQQYADLDHQLSIAEMKRCALHPAWFWIAVLDTLRYTGMRVNQLIHIRLMDINLDENWIELRLDGSKTNREWRVPILGPLKPHLQNLVSRAVQNLQTLFLTLIDFFGPNLKGRICLPLLHYNRLNRFSVVCLRSAALLFPRIVFGIRSRQN